jgi:hypothetical protein
MPVSGVPRESSRGRLFATGASSSRQLDAHATKFTEPVRVKAGAKYGPQNRRMQRAHSHWTKKTARSEKLAGGSTYAIARLRG